MTPSLVNATQPRGGTTMANRAQGRIAALFGAASVILAASAAHADVRGCITMANGSPIRRAYVTHADRYYRTDGSGCVTIQANPDWWDNKLTVRVYAHNPVIRMKDGNLLGLEVSQEVRFGNNQTVAIGGQSEWFQIAED